MSFALFLVWCFFHFYVVGPKRQERDSELDALAESSNNSGNSVPPSPRLKKLQAMRTQRREERTAWVQEGGWLHAAGKLVVSAPPWAAFLPLMWLCRYYDFD